MTMKLCIEQDQIDPYAATAARFLNTVFGLNAANVTLTDNSDLSDFFPLGGIPACLVEKAFSLEELHDVWDEWALAKVRSAYGVTLSTTRVNLITLFEMLDKQQATLTH